MNDKYVSMFINTNTSLWIFTCFQTYCVWWLQKHAGRQPVPEDQWWPQSPKMNWPLLKMTWNTHAKETNHCIYLQCLLQDFGTILGRNCFYLVIEDDLSMIDSSVLEKGGMSSTDSGVITSSGCVIFRNKRTEADTHMFFYIRTQGISVKHPPSGVNVFSPQ